jgi:hypothetical protein
VKRFTLKDVFANTALIAVGFGGLCRTYSWAGTEALREFLIYLSLAAIGAGCFVGRWRIVGAVCAPLFAMLFYWLAVPHVRN